MHKWELSRRQLLRTLGVGGACLPLLSATRSYAQTPTFPRRLVMHLQTEGYRLDQWLPADGPLETLPPSLAPLAPYKDRLLVLGNLTNPMFPGATRWAHGSYGGVFTAGPVDLKSGNGKEYWEPTTPSLDQIVADAIAKAAADKAPARKSLAFGIGLDRPGGGSYPGSNRCFWSAAKQPVVPETDPYAVYNQLFAAGKADAADKLRIERRSLLDFIGKDLERFRERLSGDDRKMIDSHLDSVRALEKKLGTEKLSIERCGGVWSGNPARPVAISTNNTPTLWSLQLQLIVAALKCDVTRVGTTQVGDSTGGAIVFDFVSGVPRQGNGYQRLRDWHDLGHRPVRPGKDGDDKAKVDRFTMGKLAELLGLLAKVPEGDGTLLDNTVTLWANHMEDGQSHDAQRLPWLIAGNLKGHFKTGRCIREPRRAINGPLMELALAMGAKLDFFGNETLGTPMPELRA